MTRPDPRRRLLQLALAVACCLTAGSLSAQDGAEGAAQAAREATAAAIDARQQTQEEKDAWSDEKSALVARYRTAQANVAWLAERKAAEAATLAAIEARVAELGRRLDEAGRLEDSMQDTLQVIQDRLVTSVERSLPFLPDERRVRLESLAGELVRPDVGSGEKLRRLLETLQVEAAYAASVEVYQDRISVDGEDLHADILRLGRVALFWRTPDGDRVGTYDQARMAWTDLPGGVNRNIALAMEMATRMRPVQIMELPLGKIGRIAP